MDEIFDKKFSEKKDFESKRLMTSGNNKSSNEIQANKVTDTNARTCEKCKKSFTSIESLRDHHLRFDYIQCTICHKEFSSEYDLEDHEELIHRDTEGY